MSRPCPLPQAHVVALPLRVGVLVPARTVAALPPQAVRLLAGLAGDARFEVQVFSAPQARPARPAGVSRLLAAESLLVSPPERSALPRLGEIAPRDRSEARSAPADVFVDLTGGAADVELVGAAAHGLWRIADLPGAGPLAASLSGAPCSAVALVREHGTGPARTIARARYDTKPLATLNLAYAAEKSAQMILRELARCARDGAPADLGPADFDAAPLPGVAGYLKLTAAEAFRRARHKLAEKRGQLPEPFVLRLGRGTFDNFDPAAARDVPLPEPRVWADPFLIDHAGETWCFFEDVDPAIGHGHISAGRVTEAGLEDVQVAMRQPHHMSYPFVFHHEGDLLMMPEVHEARRLEIWRCTDFPGGWELYSSALEGTPVVDSVLFRRGPEWWLFTHIAGDRFGDFCSDLHIFRVDGPGLTGLVPHRLNPVVSDAATARGGGRIVRSNGRTLRMSQDNTGGRYGWGLNVMEITRLDLDHYEERRVRHITPDVVPGLTRCHHVDALNGWFVIDVSLA